QNSSGCLAKRLESLMRTRLRLLWRTWQLCSIDLVSGGFRTTKPSQSTQKMRSAPRYCTETINGQTGIADATRVNRMRRLVFVLLVTALSPSSALGGILFQESWDDANISSRGWYDNTSVSISTAEHIPG